MMMVILWSQPSHPLLLPLPPLEDSLNLSLYLICVQCNFSMCTIYFPVSFFPPSPFSIFSFPILSFLFFFVSFSFLLPPFIFFPSILFFLFIPVSFLPSSLQMASFYLISSVKCFSLINLKTGGKAFWIFPSLCPMLKVISNINLFTASA